MAVAYLSVGANRGYPVAQLQRAHVLLDQHLAIRIVQSSSMYITASLGGTIAQSADHVAYVNAVWKIHTSLVPHQLLSVLNGLEHQFGRKRLRGARNVPRLLDLDILLYGNQRIRSTRLIVPHSRMHVRRFVLEPLAEIAPDLIVPGLGKVSYLLRQRLVSTQWVNVLPDVGPGRLS